MDNKTFGIGIGILALLALVSQPKASGAASQIAVKYATQNDSNVYPKLFGGRSISDKIPTNSAHEVWPKPIRPWDGGDPLRDSFASSNEQSIHGGSAIQSPSYWDEYKVSNDALHRHQMERRQFYPETYVSANSYTEPYMISRTSVPRPDSPPFIPMPFSYEEPYRLSESISKSTPSDNEQVYPRPFGGRSIADNSYTEAYKISHGVPRPVFNQSSQAGDKEFQYRVGFQRLTNVFGAK
jgi:hypothetical protein